MDKSGNMSSYEMRLALKSAGTVPFYVNTRIKKIKTCVRGIFTLLYTFRKRYLLSYLFLTLITVL